MGSSLSNKLLAYKSTLSTPKKDMLDLKNSIGNLGKMINTKHKNAHNIASFIDGLITGHLYAKARKEEKENYAKVSDMLNHEVEMEELEAQEKEKRADRFKQEKFDYQKNKDDRNFELKKRKVDYDISRKMAKGISKTGTSSTTNSKAPSWEAKQKQKEIDLLARTMSNPQDLAKFMEDPQKYKKYIINDTEKAKFRTPFGSIGIPGTSKKGNKGKIDWERYNKDQSTTNKTVKTQSTSFGAFVTKTVRNNPEIDPLRDHKKLMKLYEMTR